MSLIDKIPLLDDSALKNLLDNAKRLGASGSVKQKADAAELLPALEAAVAARKAVKLEAAAEKRSLGKKPAAPRAPKAAKVKATAEVD
jgi:DNA-binding NarL/FixJ family response regulator